MMKISELETGEAGVVTGYEPGAKSYRHKLLRMGLVRGCSFVLVRKAPLGDPVEIEVGSHRLTLRKSEADVLIVERSG
jgi:ferrous iron transport protein A